MNKWNAFSRLCAASLMILILVTTILCPAAFADSLGSVTVRIPADGVKYRIYSVGGYVGSDLVLDEAYQDVDMEDLLAAAAILANRLEGTDPLAVDVSADGKVIFPNLPMAIYLIVGEDFTEEGVEYHPVATLVSVPMEIEGNRTMDVVVSGKYDTMELVDISVLKVWKGDSEAVRPKSIVVQLQCNGENYGDPVTLNKDNNWRYTWKNLDSTAVWYVKEVQIPQFYTANTVRVQNTFVIENTRLVPPPTIPPRIPQTGQLWWPVYSMVCAGMAFIVIGLIRRRKSEENA